jgi:hypothetical protein
VFDDQCGVVTQTSATLEQALGWIAVACGRRLTTPARMAAALDRRARLRWRAELRGGIANG